MNSDGYPIVGPAVDYTKVGSINHKRTLAFLNHFISHTVRFLNRFSCICEEKLAGLSNRIQRIEVMVNILEAKIASIPGLEDVTVAAPAPQAPTSQVSAASTGPSTDTAAVPAPAAAEVAGPPPPEPEPEIPTMTVAKDPRYAKYFQMMKMGVPAAALRGKLLADGLDPDLLENPDAPVPGGGPVPSKDDSDEETSSASSFSDDD